MRKEYITPMISEIEDIEEYMESKSSVMDLFNPNKIGYLIKQGAEMASPYCSEERKRKRDKLGKIIPHLQIKY